jgi:hypothetical protein
MIAPAPTGGIARGRGGDEEGGESGGSIVARREGTEALKLAINGLGVSDQRLEGEAQLVPCRVQGRVFRDVATWRGCPPVAAELPAPVLE